MIETIFEQVAELLLASVMVNDSVKEAPELNTLTVTDSPVVLPDILALPLMDQR